MKVISRTVIEVEAYLWFKNVLKVGCDAFEPGFFKTISSNICVTKSDFYFLLKLNFIIASACSFEKNLLYTSGAAESYVFAMPRLFPLVVKSSN